MSDGSHLPVKELAIVYEEIAYYVCACGGYYEWVLARPQQPTTDPQPMQCFNCHDERQAPRFREVHL